ncbi:MAG: RHS repeat-associated core domain-containing protein, partial [Bacteroidota bacterium]
LDTTGLMYYNARYYDPEIGAFISPDTIVPDPANLLAYNRYMYTLGNPLRYTDPTGHSAWPPQWWTNFVEQVQLWWYGANPCNGMASATCNAINTAQQQISDLEEQVSESVKQGFTLGGECPECDDAIERAEKVAFGMKDYLPALKIVAPESKNYRDLGLDPDAKDFPDQLLEAMKNANHIDFTITGMRQLTGPNGVLTGSAEDNIPGSTNWELRTIWDDPDLRDKTTFYRNGEKISPEDILNLE